MLLVSWTIFNIVLKEKPKKPPSAVAEVPYERLDFKQSFKALKDNPNFLLLVIAFALPFGSVLAIGALMSNIFVPFGYAPNELAFIALVMLLSGVVGSIVTGAIVDKTGWYKYPMNFIGFSVITATVMIMLALTWFPSNRGAMYGLFALLGFCAVGYVPLCFSYGAELTFPLQPALINGTLALLGSGAAGVISFLGAFLAKEREGDEDLAEDELNKVQRRRSMHVLLILAITGVIATVLSFVIKEDLRRLRFSKAKNATNEEKKKQTEVNDENKKEIELVD